MISNVFWNVLCIVKRNSEKNIPFSWVWNRESVSKPQLMSLESTSLILPMSSGEIHTPFDILPPNNIISNGSIYSFKHTYKLSWLMLNGLFCFLRKSSNAFCAFFGKQPEIGLKVRFDNRRHLPTALLFPLCLERRVQIRGQLWQQRRHLSIASVFCLPLPCWASSCWLLSNSFSFYSPAASFSAPTSAAATNSG